MKIEAIKLAHYRNYTNKTFNFSPDITLVSGPNASGKSNLLEALYLLALGKSFRAQKDAEMINWKSEFSQITATATHYHYIYNDSGSHSSQIDLQILLTRGQLNNQKAAAKRFKVNQVPKRLSDFVQNFSAVLFSPPDLEMITGAPSLRRRFLDAALAQAFQEYRQTLIVYQKALRQRNRLLSHFKALSRAKLWTRPSDQLNYWENNLIQGAQIIQKKRQEFIDFINASPPHILSFQIKYRPNKITLSRLAEKRLAELAAGQTLIGPQRDDFQVLLPFSPSGVELNRFGSRGQQRLVVLLLKLAQLEYLAQIQDQRPVLLLDDIFSELDQENRQRLIKIVHSQQTIITAAETAPLPKALLKKAKIIRLKNSS